MEMGRCEEPPYIRIVEQPASKALRFRYECEGRSAGSIPGVNSTPENKTYPTIQIVNCKRRAVVVVSCVTKDSPYKAHPHNLVGRDGCKKGVCTVEVHNESMTMSFDHLGIQCVKKKDIEEALKAREEIRVDPFRQRFSHRTQPGSIDLNATRLCFQAFLEDEPGKFKMALTPVVSEIIYDKKALCDLAISKLSHCSATVAGGLEMILLCEKVAKEDISVRFFEVDSRKQVTWEALADFSPTQVHKQVAITFKTPKYKTLQVDGPVNVFIQLRRPSDGETSDPLPFLMTPLDSVTYSDDPYAASRGKKRQRLTPETENLLGSSQLSPGRGNLTVKREPTEASPNPYMYGSISPNLHHRTPSPLDYNVNPVSPNYQPHVYAASLSPTYQPATATMHVVTNQLSALSPVSHASPQHYMHGSPGPSHVMFVQPLENGSYEPNYIDISTNTPVMQVVPIDNITEIDSKDLKELDCVSLSADLSNVSLNCDVIKKAVFSQEHMSTSLTNIVNSAFDEHYNNGVDT